MCLAIGLAVGLIYLRIYFGGVQISIVAPGMTENAMNRVISTRAVTRTTSCCLRDSSSIHQSSVMEARTFAVIPRDIHADFILPRR